MKARRDSFGRPAGPAFMLVPAAVLLPEVIAEDGGRRARAGTIVTAGMAIALIGEMRAVRRRRKAPRRPHVVPSS